MHIQVNTATPPQFTRKPRLQVSWGGGEDSTALIVELTRKGIRCDAITIADTGAEQPHTYDFIPWFCDWLKKAGQPEPVIVRYQPKNFKNWPPYRTLEENCLTNGTLPSLAFGFKSCSQKWKINPQDKWMDQQQWAQDEWAAGGKVVKMIGYDAGDADIRRRNHMGTRNDPKYEFMYPLQVWGWDRIEVIKRNKAMLGRNPGKSSCFMCPAMQPQEVRELPPEYLRRIVTMESRAEPRLEKVEGLWRSTTKTRPGKMTTFIEREGLLPEEEIAVIKATTFHDIVAYQKGYADALIAGTLDQFVEANKAKDYRQHTHN